MIVAPLVAATVHTFPSHASRSYARAALIGAEPAATPQEVPPIWQALVDCEAPGRGWRYGAPDVGIDPGYPYEGGPNFLPSTWTAYAPPGYPAHAYDATVAEQLVVARRVLTDQGPTAWPVCGPHVGLTKENGR